MKILAVFISMVLCTSCVYKFTDGSIDKNLKTFKVVYFENKANYVNPQLTPKITDKLRQKIISQTKLTPSNDNPNIEISGTVIDYSLSTSGLGAGGNQSTNRLNVGVEVNIKNNIDDTQSTNTSISRSFDLPANQSISDFEAKRSDEIIKNVVDEIFNKMFTKW